MSKAKELQKVIAGLSGRELKSEGIKKPKFKVGDKVEHAIFGLGEIKALSGAGENQRVGVVFKDGLKKKLIVKYANLKKVD